MVNTAKATLNMIDTAAKICEITAKNDVKAGEIGTPDKFSRGYLTGYLHGLQAAYDTLPNWAIEDAAKAI